MTTAAAPIVPPTSALAIDGLLLLAFGGPEPGCCGRRATCPKTAGCEAECFVSGILGDNPARLTRIHEVVHHYHTTGLGYSQANALTRTQAAALQQELARRGHALPVALGLRHWKPFSIDGLTALADAGCKKVGLLILAPHQSTVSWDWYLKHAAEAAEALSAQRGSCPDLVGVVAPWWKAPGFIAANVARLHEATVGWSAERLAAAHLILTAHAIPQPVEITSPYRQQMAETAAAIATGIGHPTHAVAYQSQPSDSRVPWSTPTIEQAITAAHASGARDVLVQAPGFLVDHTEVLNDLDIEARNHAESLGLTFTRARCVHAHPAFVNALADGVQAIG